MAVVPKLSVMSWLTSVIGLAGALIGASIAWVSDRLRWRREQAAKLLELRRSAYADYLAALHATSEGLRDAAEASAPQPADIRAAFRAGNLYAAREQVELLAPPSVAQSAKRAFRQLRALRDLITTGASQDGQAYRQMLAEYQITLDGLRHRMREDLGMASGRELQPRT